MAQYRLQGEELELVKVCLAEALQVPQALAAGGCIVCSVGQPVRHRWISRLGQMEYEKSGVCEGCFDSGACFGIEGGAGEDLTFFGKSLLRLWIQVRKSTRSCTMSADVAGALLSHARSQGAWPRVRRDDHVD